MKFPAFKEFRDRELDTIDDIRLFLSKDLTLTFRELKSGLGKLTFDENFTSFEVTVTIASGAEEKIRNQFRDGTIPSRRIIVRGSSGAQNIVDGDTAWDKDFVYLKNVGASAATATVVFFK